MDLPTWLTLTDAARCVGLSKRTLRRRIDAGELSAEKRRQGAQDVWMVQFAEVQRWADNTGQVLQVPQDLRQEATDTPAPHVTDPAEADRLRQAIAATEARLEEAKERMKDLETERDWLREQVDKILPMLPAAQEKADEARQRAADEQRQRAAAEAEADKLRQELEQARQRPWWRRIFGG
jgi:chromosome segregation ATPase